MRVQHDLMIRRALALALVLLTLGPSAGWAAEYWVSYLGADCAPAVLPNGCGGESAPFRNLRYAIGRSDPGTFRPAYGDTIKVVPHPSSDPTAYSDATVPAGSLSVVYDPNPTGTPNPYLTIRSAVPGTMVYINCALVSGSPNQINTNPCYGSAGADYIHWEEISPVAGTQNGFVISGADNVRLYNATIDMGPRTTGGPNGNYWSISCNGTSGSFSSTYDFYSVRLLNSLDPGNSNSNAQTGGFGHFRCRNVLLRNFEIDNAGTGIDDKEGGNGNVYRNGKISRIGNNALLVVALGDSSSNTNSNILNLTFQQLLIVSANTGIKLNISTHARTFDGITFKNLTLYDVTKCLVGIDNDDYVRNVRFFNNLCVGNTANLWQAFEILAGAAPWSDYLSDYSAYRVLGGVAQGFTVDGAVETLTGAWDDRVSSATTSGFLDRNSITTDPTFQGSSFTYSDPATNWRLGVGNALRTAGSTNGLTTGAATAIGAFVNDSDIIGVVPFAVAGPKRRGGSMMLGDLELRDLESMWALPGPAREESAYALD